MSNETLKPDNIRLPDPFSETSCGLDEETAATAIDTYLS